jgi:hypothetical protein
MIRILADENFIDRIIRGLGRYVEGIDLLTVHEVDLEYATDAEILTWAVENAHPPSPQTTLSQLQPPLGSSNRGEFFVHRALPRPGMGAQKWAIVPSRRPRPPKSTHGRPFLGTGTRIVRQRPTRFGPAANAADLRRRVAKLDGAEIRVIGRPSAAHKLPAVERRT